MPLTPLTRFDAFDTNATNRPSALIAEPKLVPLAGVPFDATSSLSIVVCERLYT